MKQRNLTEESREKEIKLIICFTHYVEHEVGKEIILVCVELEAQYSA